MKISLFQQDIEWLEPSANYSKIEKVLQENPDTDLLIMPEMCTTGFITLPKDGQIERAEEVETRLLGLAKRYNTALCGSFAVRTSYDNLNHNPLRTQSARTEGSNHNHNPNPNRNRCYFVTPEGDVHHYDKHHLFTPGLEDKGYQAGQERCIVTWRGIRFMLNVCYDLRFPIWERYQHDAPYDILICCANWPAARQLAWDTLLRARAIENQSFCIGVNRVGHDLMCDYQGGTCAIHPYGHTLASCTDNEEGLCSFVPDMQKLYDYRQKFPSLHDAD